ncbi:MAG: hypothetical protein WDM86_02895 [Rhizomicrobium sp.]
MSLTEHRSPSINFISAIFASAVDTPVPVCVDDEIHHIVDPAFITENVGRLYASALTDDGVAFIVGILEEAEVDDWRRCPFAAHRCDPQGSQTDALLEF